jgi:enterochelin esterase-like enzyme/sugar lactone lactonase YvrE
MRPLFFLALIGLLFLSTVRGEAEDYRLGPDSHPQEGVPRGEVTRFTWTSRIFPGTQRDVWVYTPKQYNPAQPACVMVFQDGGGFQDVNGGYRVPIVFDNLIHKRQMPVTIGIFLNPGVVPADRPDALPRFNRTFEYDALTDDYARFLEEEILPEVGRKYNLTKDPNGRAICGTSSGGICAFTAAWERPDLFRRVLSFIGSFTNLRGGHAYPSLIRKYEPKPLRVFLQDGSNDLDIYAGSWFLGNQDVAAALKFVGYDHQFVIGDGGHDSRHAGAILPDALRWLWRDYPAPIPTPVNDRQPIMQIVIPGEEWQAVTEADRAIGGLTADKEGAVYFSDTSAATIYRIGPDGQATLFREKTGGVSELAFGPEGQLLALQPGRKQIVAYDRNGLERSVVRGIGAARFVVNHAGELYVVERGTGKIQRVARPGAKVTVEEGLPGIGGLALTPDQSLLLAMRPLGKLAYSYHIQPDGTLAYRQPYFDIHVPYGQEISGAMSAVTDTQGRLYVASLAGIQVCDQAGRVIGILANPARLPASHLVFGGPNRDILYVVAGGKVYRRKTRAKGVYSFEPPLKPPAPRL